MVIWKKKFTWNSQRGSKSREKRTWCASLEKAYMDSNKRLGSGTRNLILYDEPWVQQNYI